MMQDLRHEKHIMADFSSGLSQWVQVKGCNFQNLDLLILEQFQTIQKDSIPGWTTFSQNDLKLEAYVT